MILVTGATGTVGSELVKQLAAFGASVRAAVHSPASVPKIARPGVDCTPTELTKPSSVRKAMQGVAKIYLISPLGPDMVSMTATVVDEAKKAGVHYIILQSGLGANADPGMPLNHLHRDAENIVKGSGIPFTLLRPNNFMQNFIKFCAPTIKDQDTFYLPCGEGWVSYIDSRDVAATASELLLSEGGKGSAYELTGTTAFSHFDAAEIFSQVLGRKISYVDVSENDARRNMKAWGYSEWLIDTLMGLLKAMKFGHASTVTSSVRDITGREPISFSQFIEEFSEHFS